MNEDLARMPATDRLHPPPPPRHTERKRDTGFRHIRCADVGKPISRGRHERCIPNHDNHVIPAENSWSFWICIYHHSTDKPRASPDKNRLSAMAPISRLPFLLLYNFSAGVNSLCLCGMSVRLSVYLGFPVDVVLLTIGCASV